MEPATSGGQPDHRLASVEELEEVEARLDLDEVPTKMSEYAQHKNGVRVKVKVVDVVEGYDSSEELGEGRHEVGQEERDEHVCLPRAGSKHALPGAVPRGQAVGVQASIMHPPQPYRIALGLWEGRLAADACHRTTLEDAMRARTEIETKVRG